MSFQGEIHYNITVGLRFRAVDALALKRLAQDLNFTVELGDENVFTKAANCALEDEPMVVQCMTRGELQDVVAAFFRQGIPVDIEPMRIDVPYDSLSRSARERKVR